MAYLDSDGFDTYTGFTNCPGRFDVTSGTMANSSLGAGVFGYGRSANQGNLSYGRNLGVNRQVLFANFHINIGTGTGLKGWLSFQDGSSTQVQFGIIGSYNIQIHRGAGTTLLATGPTLLLAGVWYYVQMRVLIHSSLGEVQVWLNNSLTPEINLTGVNTQATANAYANRWLCPAGTGVNGQIDNLVIYDDQGSFMNSRTGETRVYFSLPNADGNLTEWTPSAGSNWQNVDENPSTLDTDYNSAASSPLTDLYAYPLPVVPSGGTIYAVEHRVIARKDDAGVNDISLPVRVAGNDYPGTSTFSLTSSYLTYRRSMPVSPASGSQWTVSEANSLQSGVTRSA
jgi:hypothetical protein